jgi:hypothetical protein
MADADKSIGFLGFKRDEDGDVSDFAVISDKDRLDAWIAGSIAAPEATEVTSNANEPINNRDGPISDSGDRVTGLLNRFRKSMTSVHSMIDFTSAVAPSMTQFFINQRLIAHAKKNLNVFEDNGVISIYSISRHNLLD